METKYGIRLEAQRDGTFHVDIDRQYVLPNGTLIPAQIWGVGLDQGSDLDAPLPCTWEGDATITPISLAEQFPAEYAYLKAKLEA